MKKGVELMEIKKLSHQDVLNILPDRQPNTHKGDYGKVLLLCGSLGYTGAAALSAMGALRCGAGLVYLGVPNCIYAIEAIKMNEAIVLPLKDLNGKFSKEAFEEISPLLEKVDAVLIGPGMGQSDDCRQLLISVLNAFKGPVVLDADGINLICSHKDILRGRACPTIITPHEGEFSRIYGKEISDRIDDAKLLARDLGAVVLLKGHKTVITDSSTTYVNSTGNPGMAVGGSGDMLSGMITGLVGQGIPCLEAAASAAWLHGAAGDLCAVEMGQYGLLPTDMLQVLPRLMK